jgi:ABC-type amino acid transport substrate-binding protein
MAFRPRKRNPERAPAPERSGRREKEVVMRIRRFRRPVARLLAALLAAALLSPGLALPAAAAGEPRVVRAGYFYNGDFMHKDDGAYAGYDVEYYYTLAGFAGWEVRFTEYDSLRSALAALERGEIDVMSGLSRTPERTEKFLVSAQKMCTAHIAVQTRADDDRFTAGDPSTMTGLTCGILRGSNVVSLYSDWCRENNLVPHVVEYDSLDQRNAALAARQVDAIAGGSTVEGAQKIAEFPSLDLYFMFSRSRPDLKEQLDRAMGILSLQDPTYSEHLFSTYFPVSRSCTPSFSAGEKAFIAAHPLPAGGGAPGRRALLRRGEGRPNRHGHPAGLLRPPLPGDGHPLHLRPLRLQRTRPARPWPPERWT